MIAGRRVGGGGSGRRESGCGEEREEEEDQGKEEGYLCDELHLAQGLELSNGCLRDLQREEVMLVNDLFGSSYGREDLLKSVRLEVSGSGYSVVKRQLSRGIDL